MAGVAVRGPSIAPGENCSSQEEIPALGGVAPTPDLKNLSNPFMANRDGVGVHAPLTNTLFAFVIENTRCLFIGNRCVLICPF